MLTRLRVTGFKNLVDADVSFGPFTCIAGPNGVGKSNLFDAITFLSDLTRYPIVEAAARVRDPQGRSGDPRALFQRRGQAYRPDMSLAAEFIVPKVVVDDFGRRAEASITFLGYELQFRLRGDGPRAAEGIELAYEKLSHINIGDAREHLPFPHVKKTFRDSVVQGRRTGGPFVSTRHEGGEPVVELHGDMRQGRPSPFPASSSPRTVVGGQTTDSHPTVLAARREMQSWRLLQLEPSALRQPDEYNAEGHVAATGGHVPATLLRLGADAQQRVACRVADLLPDVRSVSVVEDDQRRLVTAFCTDRSGVTLPARALSDGTLRFLALAVIAEDAASSGLVCLEEPENGIHPKRIPAMVELLQALAVDAEEIVGPQNPLRQVIVNTHSPLLVREVAADTLVAATSLHMPKAEGGGTGVWFQAMPDTWRTKHEPADRALAMGELLAYLSGYEASQPPRSAVARRRVRDAAEEFQVSLPLWDSEAA